MGKNRPLLTIPMIPAYPIYHRNRARDHAFSFKSAYGRSRIQLNTFQYMTYAVHTSQCLPHSKTPVASLVQVHDQKIPKRSHTSKIQILSPPLQIDVFDTSRVATVRHRKFA